MPTEPRASAALFVHGAGGGGWEWNVWTRRFAAAGWRVAAPDLLPTRDGLAATALDDYLDQVVTVAEALPSPRVLVGASLGGLLALMAAQRVEVAALVLVNPMPPAPWHHRLPERADYPVIVPWGRDASLEGTRRALPDADEATCLYAFRHWRDESGAALSAARAGVAVAPPACPLLVLASEDDEDVPAAVSADFAQAVGASLLRVPGSHVGPLLGREAARFATLAVEWLNTAAGFSRV